MLHFFQLAWICFALLCFACAKNFSSMNRHIRAHIVSLFLLRSKVKMHVTLLRDKGRIFVSQFHIRKWKCHDFQTNILSSRKRISCLFAAKIWALTFWGVVAFDDFCYWFMIWKMQAERGRRPSGAANLSIMSAFYTLSVSLRLLNFPTKGLFSVSFFSSFL